MGARLFRCFMHLQWVSLLFAISPLQFLFFFTKTKKETKKQKSKKKHKTQQTASDPLPLGCAILFFFGGFLGVLLSWFVVSFEGLAKKVAGSNYLPLFPP